MVLSRSLIFRLPKFKEGNQLLSAYRAPKYNALELKTHFVLVFNNLDINVTHQVKVIDILYDTTHAI